MRGCVNAVSRLFVSYELLPCVILYVMTLHPWKCIFHESTARRKTCVSADLMHLFLVRFVIVRLTYIWIDYSDGECIIILNTSIVIYDVWRWSFLLSSTPSMPILGTRHRQKDCLLTNTRIHVYHQYDTYVAVFHKKK